jgi:hypothetical protein
MVAGFAEVIEREGIVKDADPEVEALALLKQVYNFFGFSDESVPYVDTQSQPHRIDKKRFTQ